MLHGKPEKDWAQSAVFYQIYPMGFCGAPFENDGVAVNRIQKVKEWIPHLEKPVSYTHLLFARVYSGHLICRPDPGGEPPLPSRELHLGEVRDFCCPRFYGYSHGSA